MINIKEGYDPTDFQIDLDNLHIEWLKHPVICNKYARMEAEAEKALAQVRQEIDEQVRASDPKVSEAKVKAITENDQNYIDANYQYSLTKGYMKSVSHRKESLVNEVTLWLAEYFSASGLPKTIDGFDPERVALERGRTKIRERLNRRKDEDEQT